MIDQLLCQGAQQFGLSLSEAQLHMFERYGQELIAWNRRVNLTRITAPEEIAVKHFLDSLSVWLALPKDFPSLSLIDVGSGAGFPGLPLKIALPNIRLTLLEVIYKKTTFLQHVVDALALNGVTLLTARAEAVGQQPAHRAGYDVAVVRAVSSVAVVAEYTLPLVKVGGTVILQKGQRPTAEIANAENALRMLGGRLKQVMPVTVPHLAAERHLVVLHKDKTTPEAYPRRPGLPTKKPI